jgi:hypothetical protein
MDPIARLSGPPMVASVAPRRPAGGFSVTQAGEAAAAVAARATVSLGGLLALQEAGDGPVRDRAARRRGRDLLAALAALQCDLLGGGPPRLDHLAALAADVPDAADPALRAALSAVVVRARVTLAQWRNG